MAYHNEEARVGVDHLGLVSGLQIPEDGRVVEEGQVDHVFTLLKLIICVTSKKRSEKYKRTHLGRIHSPNLRLLVGELFVPLKKELLSLWNI